MGPEVTTLSIAVVRFTVVFIPIVIVNPTVTVIPLVWNVAKLQRVHISNLILSHKRN
jgi:hypothetical protein